MLVTAAVAAAVTAGIVVAVGAIAGAMIYSASASAEATKFAAEQAAGAQKYSAEQQRLASDHEADLLFKTEQADRELSEKWNKEERSEEAQMMKMFGMIDDIQVEESTRVDRRGNRAVEAEIWGDYDYPEPISDSEMSFS